MRDYKKMNKDTVVLVNAAIYSNYKDYCVFCKYFPSKENAKTLRVYLGKTDNYDNEGHYDNEDNSLIFVSENPHMYSFLSSSGYVISQEDMVKKGFFTDKDYQEFKDLQNGFLKQFTKVKDLKFDVDIMVEGSGSPFRYPNYRKAKTDNKNLMDKLYKIAEDNYPDSCVILRVGDVCEIRGYNAKKYSDLIGYTPFETHDKDLVKVQFPLNRLSEVITDLRKETRVVYQEVSGEQTYLPSIKDYDTAVAYLQPENTVDRSRESVEMIRERLFEFAMRHGPKWKDGKERIYESAVRCLNNEMSEDSFIEFLRDEYGECQIDIGAKRLECEDLDLHIRVGENEIQAPNDVTFSATWEEVGKLTLKLVKNDNYLSASEHYRYNKKKEEEGKAAMKREILDRYEEEIYKNRSINEYTEAELEQLYDRKAIDYRESVQEAVAKEYDTFKTKMLQEDKTSIYQASLENNFYQIARDVLMLPEEVAPIEYNQCRVLHGLKPNIIHSLYEYYISKEQEPLISGEQMVNLIEEYSNTYHKEIIEQGELFRINKLKRDLPNNYKLVPVYFRSKKFAKEHKEEKMYYQSEELNVKCLREINQIIKEQMQDNLADALIKKYGYERVTISLAMAVKALPETEKGALRDDTISWAKEIKTPVIKNSAKMDITVPKEAFELFVDAIRNEDERAYKKAPTAEEKPIKWQFTKTSKETLIRRYEMHSYLQMPRNGKYGGYTYLLFNSRIKKDPENEDNLIIKLAEDETVVLKNKNNVKLEISAKEFNKETKGKGKEDYLNPKQVFNLVLPKEAVVSEYENSYQLSMPLNTNYTGKTYFMPKSFVTKKEDGAFAVALPDDFIFSLRGRDDKTSVELLAKEYSNIIINNDTYREKDSNSETWLNMFVPNKARLSTYENTSLFKAPNGSEYEGYIYYIPNKMIKEYEEKGQIKISLPASFKVNMRKPDENLSEDIFAGELMDNLKSKDYDSKFKKPSEYREGRFSEIEENLRTNIPKEMKDRNNWVAVRTRFNEESGRYSKYLINVHNNKFAESDNPETWASFEEACKYAKENNADSIAYALDGEDNICCIDIDGCLNDEGEFINETAKKVHSLSNGMYMERSISGSGLHFFGKTNGIPIRTFSKDGELEFYQKSHFMAMTGDTDMAGELKSIDKTDLEKYLKSKCEKREPFKGEAQGLTGLSYMSDREVVDRACSANGGETFERLYNGEDLQKNHSNSDMSLMNRLAFWCNGDKEQMLRIFATSGLYRPNKSMDYYEGTAIKAIKDCTTRYTKDGAKEYIKNKEKAKGGEFKNVNQEDLAFSK